MPTRTRYAAAPARPRAAVAATPATGCCALKATWRRWTTAGPLPCRPYRNRRQPGTDVLEVRRADLATSGADARSLQIVSSRREAVIFSAGTPASTGRRHRAARHARACLVRVRRFPVGFHGPVIAAQDTGQRPADPRRGNPFGRGRTCKSAWRWIPTVMDWPTGTPMPDSRREPASASSRCDSGCSCEATSRKRATRIRAHTHTRTGPARSFDDGRRRLLVSGSEIAANAR